MNNFLESILPDLPGDVHEQVEKEIREIIAKSRGQLLGDIQMLLSGYSLGQQARLDLLRKEIDRLFLEGNEP